MVYGTGTRSYNRSTEARQNKLAQKQATEAYERGPKREILLDSSWLMCVCDNLRPHQAHSMKEIENFRPWPADNNR